MKMHRKTANRIIGTVLVVATLAGCGGDSPSGPEDQQGGGGGGGGTLNGPIKATIDGVQWAASERFTTGLYNPASKTYIIQGTSAGFNPTALLITLQSIEGPGTYSLPSALPFRYANIATGVQVWETSQGTTGTVVLTVATPTRVAGTFSFTAKPAGSNQATNTVNITNGSFDVTVTTTQ